MKFDFIIGNPPYQEETEGTSDNPVYNYFMDEAYEIGDKVELITPARFLFNAGKTPKSWNAKMLDDEYLQVLHYEKDSSTVFANTDIKGGVAITYRDKSKRVGAISSFVPNNDLRGVLSKVRADDRFESFSNIVHATEYFKISDKLYKDHPEYLTKTILVKGKEVPLVSKGHESDLTSNILDKNPDLFFETKPNDGYEYAMVFGRQNGERVFRYIRKQYLQNPDALMKYKIVLPESNNDGTFGETLVDPFVAGKGVATTQTFITIGGFSQEAEARNALKYIKSKFARALLGTLKITQHNKRETWKNIPLQDFSSRSDVDWNKTISEIDHQLYKKYNLSEHEIIFIESNVKEMA